MEITTAKDTLTVFAKHAALLLHKIRILYICQIIGLIPFGHWFSIYLSSDTNLPTSMTQIHLL